MCLATTQHATRIKIRSYYSLYYNYGYELNRIYRKQLTVIYDNGVIKYEYR
jgi:hypothetical protein